jgi:hypothetical protein
MLLSPDRGRFSQAAASCLLFGSAGIVVSLVLLRDTCLTSDQAERKSLSPRRLSSQPLIMEQKMTLSACVDRAVAEGSYFNVQL